MVTSQTEQPFISATSVRQVLDSLLYTSTSPPINALERLMLVEEKLGTPHTPHFENARLLTIQSLLVDVITGELARLRRIFELNPPDLNTSLRAEIAAIQKDGETRSSHLIAWSFLYYRYVRTDLNISPDEYAAHVKFDARTLRRYTTRSYKDLTHKLSIEEWKSRVRHRQQRLLNALPYVRRMEVFGRDDQFRQLEQLWLATPTKHVMITGAVGSGKTVFVQEFIRRQVEANKISRSESITNTVEHLIWINSPGSLDDILYQTFDSLSLDQQSAISLRDYLAQYRVIIVLDDVVGLSSQHLESALGLFSAAEVMITSIEYIPLKNPIPHLVMRDIDIHAIKQIIKSSSTVSNNELEGYADYIRIQVGGNPQAVKLALHALMFDPKLPVGSSSIQTLYERQFNRLPAYLQEAWLAFALIPDEGLTSEDIQQIWLDLSSDILIELSERHLIEIQPDRRWIIPMTARKFIQFVYQSYSMPRQRIEVRLETIIAHINDSTQSVLEIHWLACIEHIIYTQFPPLAADVHDLWMSHLLNSPLRHTHRWLAILERYYHLHVLDLPYMLDYGRSLRRLQNWEKAQMIFEEILLKAGQKGQFVLQAKTMLDMAILLRVRGAYDKAVRLLNESEKTAIRYQDTSLVQAIFLEKTQIALDQKDTLTAAYYLEQLPESPRSLLLMAEFALLNSLLDIGTQAALTALRYYTTDRFNLSAVYVLLGRLSTAAGDFDAAHQYLTLAVTMLEQLNHPFALARAKTNLALVFIHQDNKISALQLLIQAEKVQREMGDHVGLAFTLHNLNWLRQQ